MTDPSFLPYTDRYLPDRPAEQAARKFFEVMAKRRSVRMFSDRPVSAGSQGAPVTALILPAAILTAKGYCT